jgi:putative ABC transport system permease protein
MRRLAAEHSETNAGRGAVAVPLRDEVVGDVRPLLLVLTGAVTLVLLIACANVAGLLVARSLARTRELAIRTALGATRWRLVRQLTTESLLLAVAGGALAVWVAGAGANLLIAMIPEGTRSGLPFWSPDLGFGGRTALYSTAIAIASGLAFGLLPAISASRVSLGDVLRRSGRGVAGGGTRLRDVLVAAEIALTIVLLVGTGLLVRSLDQLMRVDPGFDPEQVMTARIALAGPRYASEASQRAFFEDVLARVRSGPGVQSVGAVSNLPLFGGGTNTFRVVGAPEPPSTSRPEATMRAVAGDYFDAMRIRLVAGRQFATRDDSGSTPVIMMNESLARRLFGARTPVGARLRFYAFPEQDWEVIGIVGDVKTTRLDVEAPPTIYYAQLQAPQNRMTLAVRVSCPAGACDPAAVSGAIRRAVAQSDPTLPIYAVATMAEQMRDSPAVFARRYPLLLVGLFAATALVLAVVGLYGVISYAVAQRTREFGIRVALGAPLPAIRGAVLRRGAMVAAAGVVVGVPAALALTRLMRGMLYGVTWADPMTYAVVSAVLILVALMASWIPAHRATRIEPTVALRVE